MSNNCDVLQTTKPHW